MFDLYEAQKIARKEVEKIIEADPELDKSEVEEVHLERESELAWTFWAAVPKLVEAGWNPGAIVVLVDKNDGHIWTETEESEFFKKQERTRRKIGFLK